MSMKLGVVQGAMIATEDLAEFANKVHALLINATHREHLGDRAREYAHSKWSAAKQAERMLDFYLEMINEKSGILQPQGLSPQNISLS